MTRDVLVATDVIRTSPGNPGTLAAAVAANNAEFLNDGRTLLAVLNAATAAEITLITPGTVDGIAIGDRAITVPIHATRVMLLGPFPPGVYNNSSGMVQIDLDDDTSVTWAVFRLPL